MNYGCHILLSPRGPEAERVSLPPSFPDRPLLPRMALARTSLTVGAFLLCFFILLFLNNHYFYTPPSDWELLELSPPPSDCPATEQRLTMPHGEWLAHRYDCVIIRIERCQGRQRVFRGKNQETVQERMYSSHGNLAGLPSSLRSCSLGCWPSQLPAPTDISQYLLVWTSAMHRILRSLSSAPLFFF